MEHSMASFMDEPMASSMDEPMVSTTEQSTDDAMGCSMARFMD